MCPRDLRPLPAGPVTLGTARALGLDDHDWRDDRLLRVTEGVRTLTPPSGVVGRAAAFSLALPPDCAFSHVTAARLWGLPLPQRLEDVDELDVMRDRGRPPVERRGCRGRRGLETRSVVERGGLRVTSLADTWVDLGDVPGRPLSVADLVVVGDAAVARWAGPGALRTGEQVAKALDPLRTALSRRVRPRGARALGAALERVRPGVRSAQESRVRLVLVDAGLPEPEVCAPVHGRGGGWLAEGDLVWREQRVVGEYQGAVHGGIRARSADAYRTGLMHDEGWTVLEIFAEDLSDPHRRRTMVRRFARELGVATAAITLR